MMLPNKHQMMKRIQPNNAVCTYHIKDNTMKKAKKFPFLQLQKQRFQFHFLDESCYPNSPTEQQFHLWIWHALKNETRKANISLLLLNEEEARTYNRDYRGKDYATNILSFALNEGESCLLHHADGIEGDLILCPQVAEREAMEQGKSLDAHFAHLVIHGTLHLMGYDHIEDEEADIMEAYEVKLLQQLHYPNPYE